VILEEDILIGDIPDRVDLAHVVVGDTEDDAWYSDSWCVLFDSEENSPRFVSYMALVSLR